MNDNCVMIPSRWNFPEIHPMGKSDIIGMGTSVSMSSMLTYLKTYLSMFIKLPQCILEILIQNLYLEYI